MQGHNSKAVWVVKLNLQAAVSNLQSWSSDTAGDDEPVFAPVYADDQIYEFKSRLYYNQKQLLFSEFHYTPTESQETVFQHMGKTSL